MLNGRLGLTPEMVKDDDAADERDAWHVVDGPIENEHVLKAAAQVARECGLRLSVERENGRLHLAAPQADGGMICVRWRHVTPALASILSHQLPPQSHMSVLITLDNTALVGAAARLSAVLQIDAHAYGPMELQSIVASMPLMEQFSSRDAALDGWALIFRDHYLEHSVGFVLGMERAGIPPGWIFTLAKGDQTHNRHRVNATFLARGYRSDVLDNATVNTPDDPGHAAQLERVTAALDTFIDEAHSDGRKVLVVDDGGLLARGYGSVGAARTVDAAIELTVSGLKRIAGAGPLAIPVLNMARSQVKTRLGYPEIADSCLRRLRTILPSRKLIGRHVLLIGFGTLGSRLAPALRGLGCQVAVIDTDIVALIAAAEAGYATYRSTGEALQAVRPFLLIGTTGERALTEDHLALLPDDVYLAPFATRDFSILTEPATARSCEEIPGIGRRYELPGGTAVLLGDGRSLNLFQADSIPNQGYDAYRAGTVIAAKVLCARHRELGAGVDVDAADAAIAAAGLFEAYYDRYLAAAETVRVHQRSSGTPRSHLSSSAVGRGLHACIVGYGTAGRLHADILAEFGATISVIDPKHQDLPRTYRPFPQGVSELPDSLFAQVDLWSICCPTPEHLSVLSAILARSPQARVILEKPACQGHEIDPLVALLASHRSARVTVTDQYRHARALPTLMQMVADLESGAQIDQVTITFTKDRTADIERGRFIDRDYGVLGYEWLHMLAVLRHVVPPAVMDRYLRSDPRQSELWATYDPGLFVAALTERSVLEVESGSRTGLELASSIVGSHTLLGTAPSRTALWNREIRPSDDRQRHVALRAGHTRFSLHLDPVTAPGGWQLARNHHRVTAERGTDVLSDEVIEDSPMHSAIRRSIAELLGPDPLPPPDLLPLKRIAGMAELLRVQQPLSTAHAAPGRTS
jgi:S-adenosylhomocysteine hydrolase